MPQVPVQVAPNVQPQELPAARQQAPFRMMQMADLGPRELMQAGAEVQSAGRDFGQIAAAEQAQQNETAVKTASSSTASTITNVLTDPNSGYLNLKGQAAVDARAPVQQVLQQHIQDTADGLQNDRQRQMYQQVAAQQANAALRQVNEHAAQQGNVAWVDSSKLRAQSASDQAVNTYNPMPGADNSLFSQAVTTQQVELEHQADHMGMTDPPARTQYVKDGMAGTYTGLINHLLSNNQTKAATDVLGTIRDQLRPEVADKLQSFVQAGQDKDDALSLALTVKSQAPGDINAQEKILDQRFQSKDINAEQHDMALQKLRADAAQQRGEQAENDKSVLGRVWDMKNQNPNTSITDLSAADYAYIRSRGLGQHVDSILEKDQSTLDDARLYNDLMRQAVEDPAGFMKQDPVQFRGQLTKPHFEAMQRTWLAIDRGDMKQQDSDKLLHQTVGDVKASMVAAGFSMSPKPDTPEANALDQFETRVRDSLVAAQQNKGAPLTRAEARDTALGLMKDESLAGSGVFGTGWMLTHKPVWQMTDEERAANWQVPDKDRSQITAELQKRGLPANEDTIQRIYKRARGVQ